MNRLLREPLLHFLLLGAGLFFVYDWIGGPSGGEGEHIVITHGRIEQLAGGFSRMHQRMPDAAEFDALIDDAIREEIYYREAKALSLDENDTIVRRRLRQKLEFVSEDVTPIPEPDDAQLQAYLQSNPEQFRTARRYSISHVYIDPDRHGVQLDADTRRLLAELQREKSAAGDARGRGDAFLLGNQFDAVSDGELRRLFGADFEFRLRDSPVGEWQGPVASGYGTHLVFVRDRVDEHVPPLAEAARPCVAKG